MASTSILATTAETRDGLEPGSARVVAPESRPLPLAVARAQPTRESPRCPQPRLPFVSNKAAPLPTKRHVNLGDTGVAHRRPLVSSAPALASARGSRRHGGGVLAMGMRYASGCAYV
jgi:hypothetical protein